MLPTSMKGDGYYKANSSIQKMVIDVALPLICQAAEKIALPEGRLPFTIVDYGCGEGKNSIIPVRTLVEAIRARKKDQDFSVIHDDLPTNNFNGLFRDIYSEEETYLQLAEANGNSSGKIFVFAGAHSFYDQVAPASSVHFGFSSSALHWLRQFPPGSVRDHIFHWGASDGEKKSLAELAAADWQILWEQRARELAPGARMVVTVAGSLSAADKKRGLGKGGQVSSAQKVLDLMKSVILDMVRDKKIESSKFASFSIPLYMRTLDEFLEPFHQRDSVVSQCFSVEHAETLWMDCPFLEEYKQTGDVEGYAERLVGTVRAFTEPMVVKGLFDSNAHAPEQGVRELVDEIYARMKSAAQAKPEAYAFDVIQLVASVARK